MRPFFTSVRILQPPRIVPHQTVKTLEWFRIDAPERSTAQWGTPMTHARDRLRHPSGHTRDAQHPNAFFDLPNLLCNAGAAKQQAVSPILGCLLGVEHQGVEDLWLPRLKVRHGQGCLIRPQELLAQPHGRSHRSISLWRAYRWSHNGEALTDEPGLGERRGANA